MAKLKKNLSLSIVILLASLLRFHNLGSNPPSLTWDEAAWGYNAYFLGLTAKDEFGRFLPLDYLESFGDFKPPLYAYLTVLPVKLFGLNEFATRFPSALFGVLTVLLTFYLVKVLFVDYSLAVLSALFLAISPWHIMLSRAAFEANVASCLLIAGVTFFLAGIKGKKWLLFFSAIFFSLSISTFNTARIVSPILVLILVIIFWKNLWQAKKLALSAAGAGILILLPVLPFLFTPQAKLRFKEVNIFSGTEVVVRANQEIVNDKGEWWSKIIHNRRWGYTREFLKHYFDHLNPSFLFIKGDGNPKLSTQDIGVFYLWDLPFLLVGLAMIFQKKPTHWWLILVWILVGIIPSALARETPHSLRIETTLPCWQILIAFGFRQFMVKAKNIFAIVAILILGLNLTYFQHGYIRHYRTEFSDQWQFGYKEAIEFINTNHSRYDEVWFTDKLGRPYIYYLFYSRINPTIFLSQARVERDIYGFVKVRAVGKYHFFSPGEEIKPVGRVLYINEPKSVPKGATILQEFNLLNGQPALVAYET